MKPQYVQALALLFWGLQADLLWFAIPMAIILEARYFMSVRWALTKKDFYQIADLTALGMTAMLVFLFVNAREYHFVTTLLSWLPIVFFPLTVVFAYSTSERTPLDVLFHSLRRQKEPVKQSWDMDYLLLGAALLGAATNARDNEALFFPVAALIVFLSLFRMRTRRFDAGIWMLTVALIVISATATHQGIRASHLWTKAKAEEMIANWIKRRTADPLKTRTALGRVGDLKLSDAILFRVKPGDDTRFPSLLHEASYDQPGTKAAIEWAVMDRQFAEVPHFDDFEWRWQAEPGTPATIYLEFEREHDLVPVPANLRSLIQLPATEVAANAYGAVQGRGMVPSPSFDLTWGGDETLYSPPGQADRYLPETFRVVFDELGIERGRSARETINLVRAHFQPYGYSLYQGPDANAHPLRHFLLESKAGHCEYFASASALMLRYLGIPSRYVVGYAVQEYSPSLGMYIVRQRHGHAWTIAWADGEWHVVDTTPARWAMAEQAAQNPLRPLVDCLSNQLFLFQLWWNDQELEDYETELYILGAILVLLLIWRIATGEQVRLEENDAGVASSRYAQGLDSPLFRAESALAEAGLARYPGELWPDWLGRINEPGLKAAIPLHNRARFSPGGLAPEEFAELERIVNQWLKSRETAS